MEWSHQSCATSVTWPVDPWPVTVATPFSPPTRTVKNQEKISGPSECEKWWNARRATKWSKPPKEKKEEHRCGKYYCTSCKQHVLRDHLCYLRPHQQKKTLYPNISLWISNVVWPTWVNVKGIQHTLESWLSRLSSRCNPCSKCQGCRTSLCGKADHSPNFVVAHIVCPKCPNPWRQKAICKDCGSRCPNCNEEEGPCPRTCGSREVVFEGDDTAQTFGRWLLTVQHRYCKVIAHNMKGYDGYFLLEYLVGQSMRPNKIIYNGSNIMYMTVQIDLHIKVIDSLNFLPM